MISSLVLGVVMATPFVVSYDSTSVLDSTYTITTRDGGVGAGFLLEDGTIFTAAHVVEGFDSVELSASLPSQENTKGSVVYSDSVQDIAVIKPEIPLGGTPLKFSEVELINGDLVFASGSPIGSAVVSRGTVMNSLNEYGLVQSEIPIEFGNSGGPLVNQDGLLVGMVVSKSADIPNIAFAVPVTDLMDVYLQKYGAETNSIFPEIEFPQVDLAKVDLGPLYAAIIVALVILVAAMTKRNMTRNTVPDEKIVIVLEKEEKHAIN
jgi:S1-C subfamily serine protease